MANGASRLFEVMKNTGESTNNTPSQLVSLTIKSVNPLILVRDDRLEIPAEFCILHKSLNIDSFRINDVVTAIVLNNGQQYFIIYNNTAEEQGANYNDLSNKPKINNVTLIGNKTASDLDLDDYTNLDNKPKINGVELNGNKTSNDLGLLNKVINVVVANTDLDDYKEDGEFYFGVDYTPTNIPTGVNGWLKVITGIQGSDNIVKQIWYRHGTPNSNDYETYVRTFSSNVWSSWKMFGMQSSIDSLNNNKVSKSGDTMTGSLTLNKTSYNYSGGTIPGTKQATSTTIPNLINELRYSNGQMGSVEIKTAYTLNSITIATGWYNYIYVPHRTGGLDGSSSGDNSNFGSLILTGMTVNCPIYVIRYSSSQIAQLQSFMPSTEEHFVHLGSNSTQFSFSLGDLTGGYCTYIIYGGWQKHFMYLLTVHPGPQNVVGYNQIYNNTGEANITNVTISNNIVTITFSSTIWGGIQVIGQRARL